MESKLDTLDENYYDIDEQLSTCCFLSPPFPVKDLKCSQLVQSVLTTKLEDDVEQGEKLCEKKIIRECTNSRQ